MGLSPRELAAFAQFASDLDKDGRVDLATAGAPTAPLFVYLQGELRIYYVPLAIVVGMALLASLFVAFTFIPALAAKVLGAQKPKKATGDGAGLVTGSPAHQPLYVRFYSYLLGGTMRFPIITMIMAAVVLAG